MPAPKKNKFWKLRSSHGRDKIFASPLVVWEAACEYFDACEKNPLKEQKVFSNGKRATVELMRPFTLRGLFIFLDIHRKTWERYKEEEDFCAIIEKIEDIIYTQKFEGAAAGLLKENIISRELGLADKKEINLDNLSPEQTDRMIREILKDIK